MVVTVAMMMTMIVSGAVSMVVTGTVRFMRGLVMLMCAHGGSC
jgi:hypothetical protein